MAEAAVSFVLERLANLLDSVEFHTNIRKEIERIQDELKRMRCFLRHADSKQVEDERICNWVSEIRNIAYDTEDIIDIFLLKVDPLRRKTFVNRCSSFYKEWKSRCKVARELGALYLRLQDISASRITYGINNVGDGTSNVTEMLTRLRRSSPRVEERDLVGLEYDTMKLVSQLVSTGDRWRAISIVGMGGIGKTTLAKKVYNHPHVAASFPSRAWIYVSQEFSARYILQAIIRQVGSSKERLEALDDEELEELLYENLKRARYLVVLDDVWNTKDWGCLSRAFPDRSNGSRLLLTTRNRSVALHIDPRTVPYDLQFLSKDNSWELFCKKVFIGENSDSSHSQLLKEIGREIVDRCAGLPLAIIVVGGLLSRKRKPGDWERVLNTMDTLFARDSTGVGAILSLSYNDLPFHLKSCFLYLGHFPEDYLIPTHKLFRLWIAEGLIPPQGDRMEDVAEDYLNELVERNMVQVAKTSANERIKYCRLHDLLRDLSISKAKEENFLEIPGDDSASARCRRHPIYSSSHLSVLKASTPRLRSLLFFRRVSQVHYKFFKLGRNVKDFCELSDVNLDFICKGFKLLGVLELDGISCSSIPTAIGQLNRLKYLGLRRTNIIVLPSTIHYLQSLQTLDVAENLHLRVFPNVIWRMMNLRHLYMCGQRFGGHLRIDTLRHLQTLSNIHVDGWKQNNSANLTSLRKLGLRGNLSRSSDEIFKSIALLFQLQTLKLHCEEAEFPSLVQLASIKRLTKLHLRGTISKFPSPQHFPPNLSQLTLEYTHLKQESIEILEKLPKLLILRLRANSYSSKDLWVSVTGFPQLESLEFNRLEALEEFSLEVGSLGRLKHFKIANCRRLRALPQELRSLRNLHELEVEAMPKLFVDRLGREDLCKVHHVHSIILT